MNITDAMGRKIKPCSGFEYVRNTFQNASDAKIKEGIFIGPQIRELMQDKQFDEDLNEIEKCMVVI